MRILRNLGHEVKTSGHSGYQIIRLLSFFLAQIGGRLNGISLILIDVFSTRAFYFAVFCSFFSRLLRIKYGLILHGGNLPARFKTSRRLSRYILNNAVFVSSPSNYLANSAKTHFDIEVIVIPNPIQVTLNSLNLERLNRIFWVRSLNSIYNPEMAVEVLKEINSAGLDFELIFIGPGDPNRINAVRELASNYGLSDKVILKGRMEREEWQDFSRNGKYFINTTNVDNTPSSVIEAMALGLIPISTNVGGIPYILEDGADGMLVEANDSRAMAETIVTLEKDEKLIMKLRRNGAEKFKETYSMKKIENAWKSLIKSIPQKQKVYNEL
ncbi:glycosyltransferase family 4 protein [Schleiferiaceae bacterium]|nr:glycosyltransferase family 4 protein [Schleiferiaceae bacterium]